MSWVSQRWSRPCAPHFFCRLIPRLRRTLFPGEPMRLPWLWLNLNCQRETQKVLEHNPRRRSGELRSRLGAAEPNLQFWNESLDTDEVSRRPAEGTSTDNCDHCSTGAYRNRAGAEHHGAGLRAISSPPCWVSRIARR